MDDISILFSRLPVVTDGLFVYISKAISVIICSQAYLFEI